QIVKVAVNQPVAIRSSMRAKKNQNIHLMNLHVKKLEKLLLFLGVN
ncbi:STM2329 family putative cytoplasmic protein, partial [Salmonella enterica]